MTRLPKLIATSVVRGSQQGESHGGVFTIDFETRASVQHIDWNSSEIDFEEVARQRTGLKSRSGPAFSQTSTLSPATG